MPRLTLITTPSETLTSAPASVEHKPPSIDPRRVALAVRALVHNMVATGRTEIPTISLVDITPGRVGFVAPPLVPSPRATLTSPQTDAESVARAPCVVVGVRECPLSAVDLSDSQVVFSGPCEGMVAQDTLALAQQLTRHELKWPEISQVPAAAMAAFKYYPLPNQLTPEQRRAGVAPIQTTECFSMPPMSIHPVTIASEPMRHGEETSHVDSPIPAEAVSLDPLPHPDPHYPQTVSQAPTNTSQAPTNAIHAPPTVSVASNNAALPPLPSRASQDRHCELLPLLARRSSPTDDLEAAIARGRFSTPTPLLGPAPQADEVSPNRLQYNATPVPLAFPVPPTQTPCLLSPVLPLQSRQAFGGPSPGQTQGGVRQPVLLPRARAPLGTLHSLYFTCVRFLDGIYFLIFFT